MGVSFKQVKDELVVDHAGTEYRYVIGRDGLGPEEAERLSHDLLMLADQMYSPNQSAPELLEPETAMARGEDPVEHAAVKSVEPTKPGNTVKSGGAGDVRGAAESVQPESRSASKDEKKK